jgi:ABC-type iron transport system FetAB ATPase subunit
MRTIVMRDSELVYAIGGLIASFRWLDEYRIQWAGKSVNDVTEEALRQRLGALEQMVTSLNGEYPGVDEDYQELCAQLRKTHEKTPWDGRLPKQLEQAAI